MGAAYQKAMLLYAHRRYADAEVEFANALAENPRDELALSHLALCLAKQRKLRRAAEVAELAIEAAPESSFPRYVSAVVQYDLGDLPRANRLIRQAIKLSPLNADYFALLALSEPRLRNPRGALQWAEEGLRLDPTQKDCGIARAEALIDLGRSEEAAESLSTYLADDPELPNAHAARGWALLSACRPRAALPHFREALRLDPNFGFARDGYVEVLKRRNPLYRVAASGEERLKKSPIACLAIFCGGILCVLAGAYTGDHDGMRGISVGFRVACACVGALLWFPVLAGLISDAAFRIHPVLRHSLTLRRRISGDAALVLMIAVTFGLVTGWLTGRLWLATLVTDVGLLGIPLMRKLEVRSNGTPPPDRAQLRAVFWGQFLAAILATGVASDGSLAALAISGFLCMLLGGIGYLLAIDVRGLE